MNLVRKYKISKLLNQPLTTVEEEIILFIQDWLKDLIPFKYGKTQFYMKEDGKWVLEQNDKYDYIYVRYKDFWEILKDKYLIRNSDIQKLLKFLIEEAFKQQVKTIPLWNICSNTWIEESFKRDVKTPMIFTTSPIAQIEEAFKQKVKTPQIRTILDRSKIEEAFKKSK